MKKEMIIKKLLLFPKKHLIALVANPVVVKSLKKDELVKHIYTSRFVNTT